MTVRPGPSTPDRTVATETRHSARPVFTDLLPRLLSSVCMIAAAIGTAFLGGQWFAALWWMASLAIFWEWQTMVGGARLGPRFALGGAALTVAQALIIMEFLWSALAALAVTAVVVGALAGAARRGIAGAGLCYAGALTVSVNLLRDSFPFGLEAILWLFAVVWGTDVMAYFGGRLIGGPKLWPRVSPSKTWAGFLVGTVSGALAGVLVAPAHGPYFAYFAVGLLAAAASQGGDLFESSLKRRFGVKDSSRLIPGHGGVMDRLDGFLTAATLAAILGVARFGVEAPGAGLFRW